jgi:release factor glutamine methyltransferase
VPSEELSRLEPELRHEPRIALDGGSAGIDFYHRIVTGASAYLHRAGYLVLEMGYGQRREIENIFQESGKFEIIDIVKDYSRIDRVMVARLCGEG